MDIDQLKELIRTAQTRKEVVDQFPGNRKTAYKRLQRFCERHLIDTSHLVRQKTRPPCGPRLALTDVLIEHSTYQNRGSLKRRLLNAGLLENQCECGQGPEWKGNPLTLQLDHRNGKSNDNRLENLRLICPNCHSQTSNYAGRNSIRR